MHNDLEGGTALRNMILSLSAPTDNAAAAMADLGLEVFNAEGKMRPMNEIFQDLDGSLSKLTDEEKTNVLSTIFNKVDLKSANALLANSGERFDELSGYIDDSAGAAANMAETMNDNLKGKLTEMSSALEGLGIAFYEKFSGPAKEAVESVTTWFSNLTEKVASGELDNALSGIATAIAVFGASLLALNIAMFAKDIAGLISNFRTYEATTKLAAGAQALLNLAMSLNPIALVAIAVAGLVAGLVVLWNTNEDFRNSVISAWEAIKSKCDEVWTSVCNFFTETIPNAFQSMCDFFAGIPEWFSNLWTSVTDTFTQWGDNITNFFTTTIPQWIENIANWFNELPYKIGEALGTALANIVNWGVETWNYLTTNVPIWIENVSTWFSALPGKIWTWLTQAIQKIVDWGSQTYNKAKEWTTKTIASIVQYMSELPGKIWTWLTQAVQKIVQMGSDMVSKGKKAASETVTSIANGFTSLPGKMLSIGKSVVEGIWNGITGMGSWISSKISSFCSGIVNGFKKSLKINSPSKIMRDKIGVGIVEGIDVGIEKEMPNLDKDINNQMSSLANRMKATVDMETAKVSANITTNANYTSSINSKDDRNAFLGNLAEVLEGVQNTIDINLDGKTVATATAPFMNEELAFLLKRKI